MRYRECSQSRAATARWRLAKFRATVNSGPDTVRLAFTTLDSDYGTGGRRRSLEVDLAHDERERLLRSLLNGAPAALLARLLPAYLVPAAPDRHLSYPIPPTATEESNP